MQSTNLRSTPSAPSLSMSHHLPSFATGSNSNELNTKYFPNDVDTAEEISITTFIETFEAILTKFSKLNKLQMDDIWEKLLVYSLPPTHKKWFASTLGGRHYSWPHAKNLLFQEFNQKSNHHNN